MSKITSKCSKKSLQAISKAEYQIKNLKQKKFKLRQSNNKTLKHYSCKQNFMKHFTINQQFQGQQVANSRVIIDSIKKLYLTNNICRIDENFFIKNHQLHSSYLSFSKQFSEIIEIYQIQKQDAQNQTCRSTQADSNIFVQSPIKKNKNSYDKKINQKEFLVYVIHHCNSTQNDKQILKWEKFVQKFEFKKQYHELKQAFIDTIKYTMIFSYKSESSSLCNLFSINKSQNFVLLFLKHYFDQSTGNQENIKKLQGYIFQHEKILKQQQLTHNKQRINQPCYSLQLKRNIYGILEIKRRTLQCLQRNQQEFIKSGQIKDPEMRFQNTVCKFMFDQNNDLKKVRQKVLKFIKWENELRKNHNLNKFQKYLSMDILEELGNDRMGRPVVLFKVSNFVADLVTDTQDYYNFFFYFLIIHLMRNSKGYSDDIIFIGDASNASAKNFKMDVNALVMKSIVQMMPLHIRSIIIYRNNSITFLIYKILNPILPDYAQERIKMYRDEFDQVRQSLLFFMDDSVIPQILGGQKKTLMIIQGR